MTKFEIKLCKVIEVTELSTKQRQYIKKWSEEWELSLKDIIETYCTTTEQTGKLNWLYWDALNKNRYIKRILEQDTSAPAAIK